MIRHIFGWQTGKTKLLSTSSLSSITYRVKSLFKVKSRQHRFKESDVISALTEQKKYSNIYPKEFAIA